MSIKISYLSQELKKLKISRFKSTDKKKYLIDYSTRKKIKEEDIYYLGIILFRSHTPQIYNSKKEFYLNQTELFLNREKMFYLTALQSEDPEKIIYQKCLDWNLKISPSDIKKILQVENSKVRIYTLNVSKIEVSHLIKDLGKSDLVGKLSKMKIQDQFQIHRHFDFYQEPHKNKTKKDIYQNIINTRQNHSFLDDSMVLELDSKHQIRFKYHFIYQRLF